MLSGLCKQGFCYVEILGQHQRAQVYNNAAFNQEQIQRSLCSFNRFIQMEDGNDEKLLEMLITEVARGMILRLRC